MKSAIHFSLLLIAGFLTVSSCKDSSQKKNIVFAERKTLKKEKKSITLGNTGISFNSNYEWSFNAAYSKLSDQDRKSYLVKEAYQSASGAGYCLVNYSLAKAGINLSLKNGIAGAISGLAKSSNTEITNRVDSIMDYRYGFPAIYSKGQAIAKTKEGRNMEYRLLVIVNKQKMYVFIGIFKPTEKTLIRIFEETLKSVKLK